jgi:ATP-dependent helicase/nuclease subunit B
MKLLIGQANSGKTENIFAHIAERLLKQQGNPVLLTPSTNAAEVLMNRFRSFIAQDLPMSSRPVLISFPALSQKLLKIAGQELDFITAIQRYRLLRSVIAELVQEDALKYFDKTADKAGLVHSLTKFINELWRSGIAANEFAEITRNRSKKDEDIALIYKRYEAALNQAKAIDAEGAGLYALRRLEAMARGDIQDCESVVKKIKENFPLIAADGFDFYTPVQVKILSQLSKFGIEVIAALTFEEDRTVHLWQKRTLERFVKERAEINQLTSNITNEISTAAASLMRDHRPTESDNGAVKHDIESQRKDVKVLEESQKFDHDSIRKNEKFGRNEIGKIDAKIKIISAPDRAVEVRAVAREIKRLVIVNNFTLDDLTIVCRSLDMYAHHFERIFNESSIPLELDNQFALGENPFIVALLRLLSLAEKLFQRRAVIECLRSPYFDLSEFKLDEKLIDLLEKVSFTEKITQTRTQWVEALETPTPKRKIEGEEGDRNSSANELLSSLAANLNKFFDSITFKPAAQRHEYVREINQLITTLKIGERIKQSEMLAFDEAGKRADKSAQQTVAAHQAFLELMKSLGAEKAIQAATGSIANRKSDNQNHSTSTSSENQKSEKKISWSAFFAELEGAVSASSLPRFKQHSPTVVVQEAHNLRPRNYRAIFLIGLIEGEFPKKFAETTPYTLAEKAILRNAGIDFAETTGDAGADLTQFHKAIIRTSERLYLSYARSDFSGGELLKSYLIDEVKAVAKTEEIRLAQVEKENETMVSQDVLSLEELALLTARQMRKQLDHLDEVNTFQILKQSSAILDANLRSWPATLRGAILEHRRLTGKERGIFGGIIFDKKLAEGIKARFSEDYLWSASKINNYGLCPFRFFADNVLNLSPIEEPGEGFVADRLGSAYHEILEKTYSKLQEKGIELTTSSIDEATAIAEEICEATLQQLLDERKIRKSGVWDFDKSEIKKRILNLLRHEALSNDEPAAKPLAFEQLFGFGNKPPLVLENREGKIKIRGSIDRIDKTEAGLVIVDYKTSRSPISPKEALEGRNLQLPIYLLAANRVLKRDEPVTSGFYLHIHSCKKGSEFPNKTLAIEEITAKAEEYIGEYVNRARRAEFPIEPNQNRCPPYCKFDVMCRIQSLGSTTDDE